MDTTRDRRVCRRCAVCVAMLIAAVQPAVAQDLERHGTPIAWQYSKRVPAGTIRGVIMTEEGLPISGAIARIAGRHPGVLAGADGRFELTGISTGPVELRVESIGHKPATIELVIPFDAGVTVFALLPDQPVGGRCELAVQILLPLVEVIDSVSGRAPRSAPVLRLERDGVSLTQESSLRPEQGDVPVSFTAFGVESSGTYRMIVMADGYRPWVRGDVRIDVEPGLCANSVRNDRFVARLVPLR